MDASLNKIQELGGRTSKGGTMAFDVGDTPLECVFEEFDPSDEKSLLDKLSRVSDEFSQSLSVLSFSSFPSVLRQLLCANLYPPTICFP